MFERRNKNKIILTVLVIVLAVLALSSAVAVKLATLEKERKKAELHGENGKFVMNYSDSMLSLDISSPQGFVYDVKNDVIIFSKGSDRVVYPGSTTKLLTALFALRVLPADREIAPGNELSLVKEGSSVAYIKEHHILSVEMLVEAMLIPSGNDAAYVIAAAAGREIEGDEQIDGVRAVDIFMTALRQYASEIGLCGTALSVPDGYGDSNHYTTTEDMIIVSRLAMENELIMKYASMPRAEVVYASGHTNEWTNTNKLLDKNSSFYSPYVTGLKTGSIDGECSLVFSFEFKDGREYIGGVFGSPDKNTRFYDALKIIESMR